jgi:8-oxo-dGTP pyrophosphatase MutT (NUDIX family)
MYKIHINDSLLTLASDSNETLSYQELPDAVQLYYYGLHKTLVNVIDSLEKSPFPRQIILISNDVQQLFGDLSKLYRRIDAAGGLVRNKDAELLMIFRRKVWDLPKGKLDPGESFKQAAEREVIEETGLKSVKVENFLTSTFHTYRTRRRSRVLKYVEWYRMKTKHTSLDWEVEEDIEEARWIDPESILSGDYKIFASIRQVISYYLRDNMPGEQRLPLQL